MSCLNRQDKLIFRVSIETGLRISDVLNLRAWYLDRIMYVQERKTGKWRTVTLSDALFCDLRAIKESAIQKADKTSYAFRSARSAFKHVHRSTYHRHLKNVCKHLKINFSAHSTRKSYAQELFKQTGDISAVQKAMGHKYVNTTAIYLDIDITKLINSQQK